MTFSVRYDVMSVPSHIYLSIIVDISKVLMWKKTENGQCFFNISCFNIFHLGVREGWRFNVNLHISIDNLFDKKKQIKSVTVNDRDSILHRNILKAVSFQIYGPFWYKISYFGAVEAAESKLNAPFNHKTPDSHRIEIEKHTGRTTPVQYLHTKPRFEGFRGGE